MSTILNARYISSLEEEGLPAMIEVVYDDKVEYPMEGCPDSGGYEDLQTWVAAGNVIQTYNDGSQTAITNSDDWIAQVRGV